MAVRNPNKKKYMYSVDWGKSVPVNHKSNGRIIWQNDPTLSNNFTTNENVGSVAKEVRKVLKQYADDYGSWAEAHTETVRPYKDGYTNMEEDIEVSVFAPCKDFSKGEFVRVRAQEAWI